MWATWLYSAHVGQPDPLFYDYLSPFVIGAAVGAFGLLYGMGWRAWQGQRVPQRGWSVVTQLAASTLGIYCVHIFVLDVFRHHTSFFGNGGVAVVGNSAGRRHCVWGYVGAGQCAARYQATAARDVRLTVQLLYLCCHPRQVKCCALGHQPAQ